MVQSVMNASHGKYRIGAVSKMTGIAVATLRVWQIRHQVVKPVMSQGGQRLYSDQEVKKLALIKGLNQAGHSIGLISGLGLEQLQELAFTHQQLGATPVLSAALTPESKVASQAAWPGAQAKSICLVGGGLMARMNALRYSVGLAHFNLDFQQESSLSQLLQALERDAPFFANAPDCYLIKLNSTSSESLRELQALRAHLPSSRIAVLYHYALAQELQGMRDLGVELKRENLSSEEMLAWIKDLLGSAPPSKAQAPHPYCATKRLFSNEALAHFAQLDNPLLCECPKHLAQIVEQLSSFEQYSLHCMSQSPQDEALHRSLHQVSSTCRAMFEQSLLQVVKHEGLDSPV
jgi:DNA-binding transcriptional MerR regulator